MPLIEGVVRRATPKRTEAGQREMRLSNFDSLPVAQVEPACFEMSRAGRRFALGNSAAITGIANLTTLPTTTALFVLWNADPIRAYAFEELGMYLTSGTPGAGGTLLAALIQAPAQLGSTYAGTAISSMSNGSQVSKMIVKTSVTITQPTAPNWMNLANSADANVAAFPGSVYLENRNLQGALVVPPGQGLALDVVAPAGTTPLFAPFARWIELETDLE